MPWSTYVLPFWMMSWAVVKVAAPVYEVLTVTTQFLPLPLLYSR
ncbi:hypothetical protein OG763_31665 [Streptomyces sp. NBC_01230]|nr:hypothetical protein OG763_31665 [Streptomyces sp. NBC_01230]